MAEFQKAEDTNRTLHQNSPHVFSSASRITHEMPPKDCFLFTSPFSKSCATPATPTNFPKSAMPSTPTAGVPRFEHSRAKPPRMLDPWNDPVLADELISGHHSGGGHAQQPHLAFVPLPSLSLGGKADGRVRRFALLGYANPDNANAAASIYRTLAAASMGRRSSLTSDSSSSQIPAQRQSLAALYPTSRCWVSVTPLAIARGFKVPTYAPDGTPLSSNERHLRRHAEWTQLVRSSLRDIRLPADLVDSCQIHLTPSPHACYRARGTLPAKDERAPFIHARIEFSRPVRGPLLVGDRRYKGFGLFIPSAEA